MFFLIANNIEWHYHIKCMFYHQNTSLTAKTALLNAFLIIQIQMNRIVRRMKLNIVNNSF